MTLRHLVGIAFALGFVVFGISGFAPTAHAQPSGEPCECPQPPGDCHYENPTPTNCCGQLVCDHPVVSDAEPSDGEEVEPAEEADPSEGEDDEPTADAAESEVAAPSEEEAGGADERLSMDDLFPDDGDMEELVEDEEEDLAIPDVVVRAEALGAFVDEPVGGAVQSLGEEELRRFAYDDPNAVLAQATGVYLRQEDGYGLRPNIGLRGVTSERSSRVTLLEDGVLFGPAPYAAPAAYFFPLMNRMVGVDLYMGAAALPYGPALVGGAIGFRSREISREPTGGLDLAFGSNFSARAHGYGSASNEWGGFLIEAIGLRTDGFKHYDNSVVDAPDTGFDRGELVLRGELHGALSSDVVHRLELRLGISAEDSNETYLGLTDDDFRSDPNLRYRASLTDRMRWWRSQVQLRHVLEVGEDFRLTSVAYRHDMDRSWNKVNGMGSVPGADGSQSRTDLYDVLRNPRGSNAVLVAILRGQEDTSSDDHILIGTNARRFGATGLQSDGRLRLETGDLRHRIAFGARLHHDDVYRLHDEDAFAMQGGELVRRTDESYVTRDSHAQAMALSAYLSWGVTFEGLRVAPGVRTELIWTNYDDIVLGSTSAFRPAALPGISASYAFDDAFSIFAGVMRGFAPVAPGQAASVGPEDSINYELGVRFEDQASHTNLSGTLFLNTYEVYLQQCSFASGCADAAVDAQANGGAPVVGGLELSASTVPRLGTMRFPMRATYTFTYSELREAVGDVPNPQFSGGEAGDHLPYLPEHQLQLQAGAATDDIAFNVAGSFVSEMWEAVASGNESIPVPQTEAYFVLDATVDLRLWDPVHVFVRGQNLTFARAIVARRPFGARPSRPFQIQVGLKIDAD